MPSPETRSELKFRHPVKEDGAAVFDLIHNAPPLDQNSRYCNLLQCFHFADTCLLAEEEGRVLGFVSAYLRPDEPTTLFVWQVAIDAGQRGRGLASRLLLALRDSEACRAITHVEASITPDNRASWALFERLAQSLGTRLQSAPMFDADTHFAGCHDSEVLVRLGPLP